MITIREATIEDKVLLREMGEKTFVESHGRSAQEEDIASFVGEKYTLPAVEDELKDPRNKFHILYYNDHPAGFSKVIYNLMHPIIQLSAVTKLEKIYLLEAFYDLGLGRKLFEFILKNSKKENQNGIWLLVWKENHRAIRFYEKNGFKVVGTGDYRISESHSNPNYIMFLEF